MKFASLIVVAAALGAVAAPALAAKPGDQDAVRARYDAKTGKYCVSQKVTGSFLPITDCRTKEEWAKAAGKSDKQPDTKLAQK
jgi:ABC-type sugar transport system substrate-binding protein